MAVGRETLDALTCAVPGCDHTGHDGLVLHSRCHPEAPTWAEYKDGELRIVCATCEADVAAVAVADEDS